MKTTQRKEISFKGQSFYVGLGVHLKSWSVTVLSATSVMKKFSMSPVPDGISLEMRSLTRLKNSITKDTTRQKNSIKSQLHYLGVEIPSEYLEPFSNWKQLSAYNSSRCRKSSK